ncbi:nuclear transport factor 2 family protein [Mucilaginibacter sp. Mucisp86]|uniref:nuclear transport factor 2 family protein n=1 Tax=Mucilaginibacter sp. Mucisp86 TaxID=3243060 RepID=UPI0039B6D00F
MKDQIIETITALFAGADERDWGKVKNALAENVELDYSSMTGNPASTVTSEDIITAWRGFLPGFDETHHQLADFYVMQNGSAALVHYYGKADHFIGDELWTVEGTYDTELIESNDKWIIAKHKLNLIKQDGNMDLPAQAAARVSERG